MLIENTISKLQEMKMTTMAKAFREQLTDTNITSLPFEDRFGLIVDQEWTSRKNNHLKRLIKQTSIKIHIPKLLTYINKIHFPLFSVTLKKQ